MLCCSTRLYTHAVSPVVTFPSHGCEIEYLQSVKPFPKLLNKIL